ncbi:biotin--[acetyl-CoA-carboxylase] ligase [Faecalimonas sp.]
MKPVIDLDKEYAIMLDGGGARGAYQIGAWKALREAGVKINAVAGTSVGALNGAFICMDDVEKAEKVWSEITFSKVMDVDDIWMEKLFKKENALTEVLRELWKIVSEGGVDVTPLRELIHKNIDEKKIRESGKEYYIMTFSVTDMKELDLSIKDISEGLLEDFLLASAYLIGFKNEKLHGKTYIDGGVINNVPLGSLVNRGYKDIIQIRIFGPGREPKVHLTEDIQVYKILPHVKLGSIIEFDKKRSKQNIKIGYYDAQRMLYGLKGSIYYIEQTQEECYYKTRILRLSEKERLETAFELRMGVGYTEEELYLTMLEASAKLLHIQKYRIYTEEELYEQICTRYKWRKEQKEFPKFVSLLVRIGRDYVTDLMKINTKWAGNTIYSYEEIDSTNTEALRLAEKKEKHGTLVIAKKQYAGRGRRGRIWESEEEENIYMSLLLRPKFSADLAPMLTLVMAYSVAKVLREQEGLDVKIKWPNDLVIGKKKICGILTEMKMEEKNISSVIIGVGINVNMEKFPVELRDKATSLKNESGRKFSCTDLIAKIMECFEKKYDCFSEVKDVSFIKEEYNEMLINCGKEVRILEPQNEYEAIAIGINEKGELLVEKETGKIENVFAGEVSVRGMYEYV